MRLSRLPFELGRMVRSAQCDLGWGIFANSARLRNRFGAAVNNMSQGLCLYDAKNRLEVVNQRFAEIYNQPAGSLKLGTHFRDILAASVAIGNYPGKTLEQVYSERKAFIDRREPGTFLQELSNGRLVAISHQPMTTGGWVATYEDVTQRHHTEKQLKFLAQHDPLTLLPNRRFFGDLLQQRVGHASPASTALLFLDLDGFKQVNDLLGHAAGDVLLRQVADRLKLGVREGDIVARLGGDEFAVLLPDTVGELALSIGERVIAVVDRPYRINRDAEARVGVSAGVAWAPEHAKDPDELMSYADKALYIAKRTARGTVQMYNPLSQSYSVPESKVGGLQIGRRCCNLLPTNLTVPG